MAAAFTAAGCSRSGAETPPPAPMPPPVHTTSGLPELPPEPQPVTAGPCPYLATEFVANANGQRVSAVKLSADSPPTCFFYDRKGRLQLTVRVYVGEPDVARTLVDHAAPVDSSNPATQPPGWQGGYTSTDEGSVYAVAKEGAAVVVTTNQRQTIKARTVAKQAISSLGR